MNRSNAQLAQPHPASPPIVHVLFAGIFLVGWTEMSFVGILPEMADAFGLEARALGIVVALYSLSFAIAGPLLLLWFRRLPPRLMLASLMAVIALASFAAAATTTREWMAVWRVILAAASAAYAGTTMSVAVSLVPAHRRGRVLGYIAAGFGGALVGGVPLTIFIADISHWPVAMYLMGAAAIVIALSLVVFWPKQEAVGERGARLRIAGIASLSSAHYLAQFAMFVWMSAYAILFTFLPTILSETYGYSGQALTLMMVLFGISCVAGAQIGGLLADRLGEFRMIRMAFAAHAAILLAAPFVIDHVAGMGAVLVLWGIVSWMSTPPLQAQIGKTAGTISDVMLTLSNSMLHAGIAVGAWFGTYLVARDVRLLFWLPAAILTFLALLIFKFGRDVSVSGKQGPQVVWPEGERRQ